MELAITPPPPLEPDDTAFIGLEGVLCPSDGGRPTPLSPDQLAILLTARQSVGGRLAIITHLSLAEADRILSGQVNVLAARGGLRVRDDSGTIVEFQEPPGLKSAAEELRKFIQRDSGLVMEETGSAVIIHYRLAPQFASEVAEIVKRIAEDHKLQVREGVNALELRLRLDQFPIQRLLALRQFRGRRPIFAIPESQAVWPTPTAAPGRQAVRVAEYGGERCHRLVDTEAVWRWLEKCRAVQSVEPAGGWVRLADSPTATKAAAESALLAIEHLLSVWQRADRLQNDHFPLDFEQRSRLIESCETLLALLRSQVTERSLMRGVARRVTWLKTGAALVITAIVSGAATAAGTEVYGELSGDDRQVAMRQAEAVVKAAEGVDRCLQQLGKLLPPGHAGDVMSDEEVAANRVLRSAPARGGRSGGAN